ncbi:MAG: hypothetical protein ACK4K9_11470 [Bacteroidia bacterium]
MKVHCDSTNTVLIAEDMKARFYFKEGTYWIYKNIATNETDSMWVWYSQVGVIPVNKKVFAHGWNKCYEYFDLRVKNKIYFKNDKYYSNYGIVLHPIDEINSQNELFEISEISPLNNFRDNFRIGLRGNKYETQTDAEVFFEDSIITKENLVFKNILNLKYPFTNTNDIYSDMYYAKNIGLVKFERSTDNSVWELIRYKINQ